MTENTLQFSIPHAQSSIQRSIDPVISQELSKVSQRIALKKQINKVPKLHVPVSDLLNFQSKMRRLVSQSAANSMIHSSASSDSEK